MPDFELPDLLGQINWDEMRPDAVWVGPEIPWETLGREKAQKIIVAQLDFRIDVMRRAIEQMEKIRNIVTEG